VLVTGPDHACANAPPELNVILFFLNMSSDYACPCLNVLIVVQAPPPPDTPPSTPTDSNYRPVYVGEEGVSIVRIISLLFGFLLQTIDFFLLGPLGSSSVDPQESNALGTRV
jgi:hypothetical protein